MLYFRVETDPKDGFILKVLEVLDHYPRDREDRAEFIYRGELTSFGQAQNLAEAASICLEEPFLPVDNGEWVSPRYDVVRGPKVGEFVSYGFNGDYYPDGTITRIGGTNCSRVYTDTGSVYNRRRQTGSWIKRGGTWSMVKGHVDKRNPSF